jgi:hypothetical protein
LERRDIPPGLASGFRRQPSRRRRTTGRAARRRPVSHARAR